MRTETLYVCKRLRLLSYLVDLGFNEYTIIPDPTSTKGYNWWLFIKTPELEEAIARYFNYR